MHGKEVIETMSRDDFFKHFVRDICQRPSFSRLVAAGAKHLSCKQRQEVIQLLTPLLGENTPNTDTDLDAIAAAVAARSVQIK